MAPNRSTHHILYSNAMKEFVREILSKQYSTAQKMSVVKYGWNAIKRHQAKKMFNALETTKSSTLFKSENGERAKSKFMKIPSIIAGKNWCCGLRNSTVT